MSGVTRNSGPLDKYSSRALPALSLPSLPFRSSSPYFPSPFLSLLPPSDPYLPLSFHPYPFTSSLSSHSLPFLTLLNTFLPFPPSLSFITVRETEGTPQRVRTKPGRQTHFSASTAQSLQSVKFLPVTRGPLHWGPWTLPTLPAPLLCHSLPFIYLISPPFLLCVPSLFTLSLFPFFRLDFPFSLFAVVHQGAATDDVAIFPYFSCKKLTTFFSHRPVM